jgi:hypothetical protein
MSLFVRRIVITVAAAVATGSAAASAQVRMSIGAGAGIAGSTDGSLSEGLTGPVAMGQLTAFAPVGVGVGLEVDGWRSGAQNALLETGHLQFHVPSVPVYLTLGAGFGRGDPDGRGTISGTAGHIGVAWDIGLLRSPLSLTLFGNGLVVYTPTRSLQMVDGGLAITRR